MKTTLEKVFETLNKVELKSEKVELGMIEDADKFFKRAISIRDEATQTQTNAQNAWKVCSFTFDEAVKAYTKALKIAKDLGANEIVNKMNKQISLSLKESKEAKGYEKKLNL